MKNLILELFRKRRWIRVSLSKSVIADLMEGTNYKYVFAKENEIRYTNLFLEITHNKTMKNKLKDAIKKRKGLRNTRTKHIIREKFVHLLQWEDFQIYIFTDKKICPIVGALFNCIMKLTIESAESESGYKSYYFYKEL